MLHYSEQYIHLLADGPSPYTLHFWEHLIEQNILFASRQTQLLRPYWSPTSWVSNNWLGQPKEEAHSIQTATGVTLVKGRVMCEMSQPPWVSFSAGCWIAIETEQP